MYHDRKIPGFYGLKGAKESLFAFGLCSPKPIHVSYFTCRKNRGPNIFFLLILDLLLTLCNGQAAFSMPLVYPFYCEESIVSLSSKFQFSRFRMSPVDPLSDQVLRGVWLDWLCSYLFAQQQKFYPLEWKKLRSQGP